VNLFEIAGKHYLNQPKEVSLETFAKCNAACSFCPYPTLSRIGTKMDDALIDRLLGEMESWTVPFALSPFKVNEPLLDKRVLSICEEFNRRVPVGLLRMFSNGSTLTDANVDRMIGLKRLVHLWVSLNDHRPAEYEALMKLPFDRTAANLDRLHARSDFPHNVVLSAVGRPNDDFLRYCADRWPKFEAIVFKRDAWLGFTWAQETEVPDDPCARWWELSIMADGTVSHCCMDGTGEYPIGSVKTDSMLSVYNNPFWRERRERLTSRRTLDDRSPCARCTY
jgi:MoaA/NifB/PqqE/SkfB family radical SAM enzyme